MDSTCFRIRVDVGSAALTGARGTLIARFDGLPSDWAVRGPSNQHDTRLCPELKARVGEARSCRRARTMIGNSVHALRLSIRNLVNSTDQKTP